jgi:hypothetical protein
MKSENRSIVHKMEGIIKEDIKEQPTSRNLSVTATRVLQCTCPVAASRKYFSDILTVQQRQQRISI